MSKKQIDIRLMTEIGLAVALVVILDLLKLWRAPQGGSVTLALVPIMLIAFRHGLVPGLLAGGLAGVLKLFFGPYVVHPVQAILDYPLAFMLLGLAGVFCYHFQNSPNRKPLYLGAGVLVGLLGRFMSHFLAGIVFFGHYAPEGTPVAIYSLTYNLGFLVPEGLLTFAVLLALSYHRPLFRIN